MARTVFGVALLLVSVRSAAQDVVSALDPETGRVHSISELVVEPDDLEAGWLELTPLASDAPATILKLGDRTSDDEALRLPPGVPPGAALLCTGADSAAVLCEQVFLQGEAWVESGENLDVAVHFEPGLAIEGRYLLDGWPIVDARVAVVPARLAADRPFTMPLTLELSRTQAPAARREVLSDDDGHFALPPLAQGEYFLETVLPSGRVHRGEPFELPDPATLRRQVGIGEDQTLGVRLSWDLGEIDVADGLVVEFQVFDLQGEPIADARVAGRQGTEPNSLINYEALVDRDGIARLSGFLGEQSVHLSCRKEGYRTFEQDYPLLPVLVSCILEPLSEMRGEVLGIDGLPPIGAVVSVQPISVEPLVGAQATPIVVPPATADAVGKFLIGELAAGEYQLKATAPGFEVATQTIVLEPGQRLELGVIILLHGRALEGRVVDAETQEPIVGAQIDAVSPPGAVSEVTGDDGGFTLATRTEEPLVLHLSAEYYAGSEVTVTPERLAASEPLAFTMERGGRIRAMVWDETTDLPCQSCRLVIKPSSAELLTGSAGEALSEILSPGWYRVHRPRVSHLGSSVIAQDDAEYRYVRVRRGETSTIRFGQQRRTVRVVFQPALGAGWSLSARMPSRVERYHPDPGGGFLVRYREGESPELFLHRFEPETGAEVEVRQAALPADFEATEWVLPLTTGRLEGKAISDGAPIRGVRVRLHTIENAIRATARTRSDGTFVIPHLPAGVYGVIIGERSIQFASLRAGQSLNLGTFDLIAGSF